jgi:phenylacetate-CoA ligase
MMRLMHRHVLLPAFDAFKGRRTFGYWRELEETQWLARAEIEEIQFRSLRALMEHAYDHCAYYRGEWNRLRLHPRQLNSPADITHWPVIDRDTIREHRARMRAPGVRGPLIVKSTGGSTGIPMQFDLDQRSNDRRTAAAMRGYAWAGASPGSKQLYLWGAPLGDRPLRARAKDRLYQALHRRRVISCFGGEEDLAARFAANLERYRPDVVVAYTNPLHEAARRLEEMGRQIPFAPRAILIGAEKLHAFQRVQIERVFRAPVFETYGSREFMLIGAECERHCGLHMTTEQLLVEVVDDDGKPTPAGEEGNVVITDLYNYGMPFVRYAVGDRAIAGFGDCACGRGLPLLSRVVGRQLDMILGTGGRMIPGEFFVYLAKDFPAIRRYQVVQEELSRVRVALATEGFSDEDRLRFERLLGEALGPDVRVDFEPVAQIPLTAAGKLQVVVNRLPLKRAG